MSTLPSMSSKFLSNSFARASDKSKCNHKLNLQSMKINWETERLHRVPTLFLPQKIRTSKEKKGDFLAISKENLARFRQNHIVIKTI